MFGLFLYAGIWYNIFMKNTEISREKLNQMSQDEVFAFLQQMQSKMDKMQTEMDKMHEENEHLNERIGNLLTLLYGRSTEKKLPADPRYEQLSMLLNEAESDYSEDTEEPEFKEVVRSYKRRKAGKRDEDLSGLPSRKIEHTLPEEELKQIFPDGYNRLPDEVYRKLDFHPATFEVLEHHIAVYAGKKEDKIVKADHPAELLDHSIVTPTLAAGIINGKYVNHVPIARIEAEFKRNDIALSRQVMSGWMIRLSERYFSLVYDALKKELLSDPVIHADETPVEVSKDGRKAGSKSYMWVYRTAENEKNAVLYDYCKTRNTDHLKDFLGDYRGVIVSDGCASYHKLERDWNGRIRVAGCWAHARRLYANIIKSASGSDKKKAKYSLSQYALSQIRHIYHLDNALKSLPPEQRKKERNLTVRPVVEGYFAWAEEHLPEVPKGSSIGKALAYSINQKKYLCTFLDHPDVPLDNNPAEQAIRPFCVGKHNWHLIDTIHGAEASAILYSLAETAKANRLRPYDYFRYLLEQIPAHMNDTDMDFLHDLMPWSENVIRECGKHKSEQKNEDK